MFIKSVIAVAVLAGVVAAQINATYIDPNSIDRNLRVTWCTGQKSACSLLCGGNAPTNLCDPTLLTYSCLCSNGTSPNLAMYRTTLPDFICEASFAACIKLHPDDLAGQDLCKSNIMSKCGTVDLSTISGAATPSSAASTAAATSAASGSASGSATTGAASSTTSTAAKTGAAVALQVGNGLGSGVVAAGLAAAFGLML